MSKVQSSPETVRQMKADMNKTAKELNGLVHKIRAVRESSRSEWNDEKGEQFRAMLTKIEKLIVMPEETLKKAQPRLEKLAESLDAYGKVRF